MSKNNRNYDYNRAAAVKYVAREKCVTEIWVRKIIADSNVVGEKADAIRKMFNAKYQELKEVLS